MSSDAQRMSRTAEAIDTVFAEEPDGIGRLVVQDRAEADLHIAWPSQRGAVNISWSLRVPW